MGRAAECRVIDALVLRFDTPLMAFGGTAVDRHGFTNRFPARSMITGLLANALGIEHRESERLQALQNRIVFAVRCDRPGQKIVDFQTVDLGQPFLEKGWTTRGVPEGRAGSVSKETHIRLRHYLADAIYTVVLTLDPVEMDPLLIDVGFALKEPERPLFLGRKSCLPATSIFIRMAQGESLRAILEAEPTVPESRSPSGVRLKAQWPLAEAAEPEDTIVYVTDERDWANQIHVGKRAVGEGTILPVPYTLQVRAGGLVP
jgi:CRISPR system Cascade subunit CasD